jgi:DNA primase
MPKKTSFVDFRAVKAAITMEQVLRHYDLLEKFKRTGDNLSGPCPIHGGSNPTQFRVSVSKNVWNCFSECKHGGNTLDFIARMDNVSIHAAALKAIEWFGLDPASMSGANEEAEQSPAPVRKRESVPTSHERSPKRAPAAESSAPNTPLKFRLEKLERDHPYLAERGLTLETLVDFGVGYCAKGMMAERIAIPIHNPQGEVVAYAGRFIGDPEEGTPKYKLPQGFRKSLELYNLDRAIKEPAEQPLVVVEGFFSCMKFHQMGFRKVVALMGSTLSEAQEELLRKHTSPKTRIVVLLDEDEAGRNGRDDLAVRLAKFAYVKIHVFDEEDQRPEDLDAEEIALLLA